MVLWNVNNEVGHYKILYFLLTLIFFLPLSFNTFCTQQKASSLFSNIPVSANKISSFYSTRKQKWYSWNVKHAMIYYFVSAFHDLHKYFHRFSSWTIYDNWKWVGLGSKMFYVILYLELFMKNRKKGTNRKGQSRSTLILLIF